MSTSPTRWTTFHVPDLDCPTELGLIETGLRPLRGIRQLRPDYLARSLRVEHDVGVDSGIILRTILEIGFPATLQQAEQESAETAARRILSVSLRIAAGLLIAAIVLSFSPLANVVPVLAIAAVLLAGYPVAKHAWRAVCLRQLDMNALLTIASIGAVLTGEWLEAATGMVLFRLSLLIDEASKRKAHHSIRALMNLAPSTAHLISAGNDQALVSTPVEQLHVGQHIRVLPGERIPVDGTVVAGASSVNEATITGESMPVTKDSGDSLYGGSLNGEGSLDVEVLRSATDSTPARIARLIEQAQANRSPTERFVDRFARVYTPTVIALAVVLSLCPPLFKMISPQTFSHLGEGTFLAVWKSWFHRALVMLVIACPCALVLSTPITIVCGLINVSRRGILVKGGEFLEAIGRVRQIALDKTGTLTSGEPEVVAVQAFGDLSEADVIAHAAALERHSEHPLAHAIVAAAEAQGDAPIAAEGSEILRGYGVRGTIQGRPYLVSSPRYLQQLGIDDRSLDAVSPAATRVLIARDGELVGAISLLDRPRSNARQAIAEWRNLGVEKITMLTGDREAVAERVAEELKIDEFHASLLPADKIKWVESSSRQDPRLVMVGDGVNDAPALAAAPIGIALGASASDTALETSDVVMMSPNLRNISSLICISRRTRAILVQNISLALGVKLIVLMLAAAGYATMWMAVAADVGASLLVIGNGTRLLNVLDESVKTVPLEPSHDPVAHDREFA